MTHENNDCPNCGNDMDCCCACSDDARHGVTRVIFRKDIETGDIIAVFPELPDVSWGNTRSDLYTCYARIGQHSSCAAEYVLKNTRRASPREYANLMYELTSAPYEYVLRPITYAQLLSDDCNGGIGPHDYAKEWYDVGCNWRELYMMGE